MKEEVVIARQQLLEDRRLAGARHASEQDPLLHPDKIS